MVLDHIADDSIVVKVTPPAFRAKRFSKDDLHIAHKVSAEERLEDKVCKAKHCQVLHQLLAEVVVDPENLIFCEHFFQVGIELPTALKVTAEGLLNYHPCPSIPA
jgi:hypothetical protein